MDIDKVPILGKINRTLNSIALNFVILAVIFVVLAVAIIVFPAVLRMIVAILLILTSLVFLHMAYNIVSYKQKYTKWLE